MRRHAALLFAALGLLTASAFTPPGRAATGWIAGLAGFGEKPTLDQKGLVPGSAIVLASGVLEDGTVYEVVAKRIIWRDNPHGDTPGGKIGLLCLQVDFPGATQLGQGGHCTDGNELGEGVGEESGGLYQRPDSEGADIANPDAPGVVVTIVESAPTADARLFERRPGGELSEIDSRLVDVDQEILSRVGTDRPLAVLVGELDRETVIAGREGRIEVTTIAYDESGAELGRDDVRFTPASCPDDPPKAPEAPPAGRGIDSARFSAGPPLREGPFTDVCPGPLAVEGIPEITAHQLERGPVPRPLTRYLIAAGHQLRPAGPADYELAFTVGAPLEPVDRAARTVTRPVQQMYEGSVAGRVTIYLSRLVGGLVYVSAYEVRSVADGRSFERLPERRRFVGLTDARTGAEIYFAER